MKTPFHQQIDLWREHSHPFSSCFARLTHVDLTIEILILCHNHRVIDWLSWNPIWWQSFVVVMVHSLHVDQSRERRWKARKNERWEGWLNIEKVVEWWIEDLRMTFGWTFFVMFDSIPNIVRRPKSLRNRNYVNPINAKKMNKSYLSCSCQFIGWWCQLN